jgi:hypothetical protein
MPPLRSLRALTDEALQQLKTGLQAVCQDGTAINSAGEVAACATAASALLRAQRRDADGATGLQPVVGSCD